MAKVKSCTVTKRDGEVFFSDRVHQWVDQMLDTCRNGEYQIVFSRKQEPRSFPQNKLLWLWFTCIADETGQDKEDIHDFYCDMFLKRRVEIDGRERVVSMGTSGLDKETMAMFLDKVQADAATELGIRLPNPDDLNFESFREYYKDRI